MNELVRIIPIPLPFAHGYEGHVDMRARLDIEGGRDWRSPEILRHARRKTESGAESAERACRVVDVCGHSFCRVCNGNDFDDRPFTCGAVQA